jgi:hypothetical protein
LQERLSDVHLTRGDKGGFGLTIPVIRNKREAAAVGEAKQVVDAADMALRALAVPHERPMGEPETLPTH